MDGAPVPPKQFDDGLIAAALAAGVEPLFSVRDVALIDDCGESVVWARLAAGEYEGVKDGTRTKISAGSIKRRRERLKKAKYKAPPPPRAAKRRGSDAA